MRKNVYSAIIIIIATIFLLGESATSSFSPKCIGVKDDEGVLWFDGLHQGTPIIFSEGDPYIFQPTPFALFRADCVEGYPRVILGIADPGCSDLRWEADGGWSCMMPGGYWTFRAGGEFLWPRGKPEGYIDPPPIVPTLPFPPDPFPNFEGGQG